jgi:DNA-directed RNA polymerase specialized sigma54-like protein
MNDKEACIGVAEIMGNHKYERTASEDYSENEDDITLLDSHEAKLEEHLEDQKSPKPKRPSTSLVVWILINVLATIGIVSKAREDGYWDMNITYTDLDRRSSRTRPSSLIHHYEEHSSHLLASTS